MNGDGDALDDGVLPEVLVLSCAERGRLILIFMPEAPGVVTLEFVDFRVFGCRDTAEDDAEGGRGIDVVPAVLTIFVGRVGEAFDDEGMGVLVLDGVAGGVDRGELVTLTLRATLCGRGLIGRDVFSAGDEAGPGVFCSFFSSSDVLSLRRVPVLVGDGGLGGSRTPDLGRYFGKAEVALRLRGLRVVERFWTPDWGVLGSVGLDSSDDERA